MPDRPVLILPKPEPASRHKRRSVFPGRPPPNDISQAGRIERQFRQVSAACVSDGEGDVERVLVMETSSQIEGFKNAVERVEGLEWLAEFDVDDIELHDLYDEEAGKKIKGGRFYLLSSNRQATEELYNLWQKSRRGNLERGLGKFEKVFKYIITLRRWDLRDRLRDTGILKKWRGDWEIKKGTQSRVDFEIEMHYWQNETKRNDKFQKIKQEIEDMGGQVGIPICMKDIAFHALKASMPVAGIEKIVKHDWERVESTGDFSAIFHSEPIKYFRPIGQQIKAEAEPPEQPLDRRPAPPNDKPPGLALLDGAPLLRHRLLDGRIVFNDPDSYMDSYEPLQQKHGTSMASLICHGDLSRPENEIKPLPRRIYARPIMRPPRTGFGPEEIPADRFPEDIVERSVTEMFEGQSPEALGVRVINLSLGNMDQHYLHEMSPWARLLDWLSFKYKVLFIVSAGNFDDCIRLADPCGESEVNLQLSLAEDRGIRERFIRGIDKKQSNHRLLSPAESMNALTVGALQQDFSGQLPENTRGFDPIDNMDLPSAYSRIGPGYRSAIKPEIFAQGGRLLYDRKPEDENLLEPVRSSLPPGIRAAYPHLGPERLENTAFREGTSNAAAIASHGAGHIFEMLDELREGGAADILLAEYDAVLIKTLLVHSTSWGENRRAYEHLKKPINNRTFKRYLSRYLGYGNIDVERVLQCTRIRATAVGCGKAQEKEKHRFSFPLPEDASISNHLRLTVTLAWFSPINPFHAGMRRAKLFFEVSGWERQECDWQQVRKGTVQHEIFQIRKNNFPGDNLEISVECAADAGSLDDEIPYGLAITLEAADEDRIDLDLYQIVRERIRPPIRVSGD